MTNFLDQKFFGSLYEINLPICAEQKLLESIVIEFLWLLKPKFSDIKMLPLPLVSDTDIDRISFKNLFLKSGKSLIIYYILEIHA